MKPVKIKHKLIKGTIVYIALLVAVISVIGSLIFWRSSEKFVLEANERLLDMLYEQTMHFLYHPLSELNIISDVLHESSGIMDDSSSQRVELIVSQFNYLSRVEVVDSLGYTQEVYPDSPSRLGFNYSGNPYFQKSYSLKELFGIESSLVYGNTFIDVLTEKPTMIVVKALTSNSFLVGYLDLTKIQESYLKLENTEGFYSLVDDRGVYVLHPNNELVYQRAVNPHIESIRTQGYRNGQLVLLDGKRYYIQYKKIENTQWHLIYYQTMSSVLMPIINANALIFISSLTVFGVVALSIAKLMGTLVVALDEFVARAKAVASGNYNAKEIHYPYSELEDLASSFSQMIADVESREEEIIHYLDELRESKEELLAINEELEDRQVRLDRQLIFEQRLVEISGEFVSYDTQNRDKCIEYSLSVLAKHFQLDTAVLYLVDEGHVRGLKYTHYIWQSSDSVFIEDYIAALELNIMPSIEVLESERYSLFEHASHFVFMYPLVADGSLIGSLAFVTSWSKTSWDVHEIGFIKIVANLFIEVYKKQLYEKALIASREAAQAASIAKSQFLANMSHEIRTPMHGIFGYLELLKAEMPKTQARGYLEDIHKVSKGLMRLIDDVLDLSKIESGSLKMVELPFNLVGALHEAVDVQDFSAKAKGLEIIRQVDPLLPLTVVGDEDRFKQIVFNLLSNAIKFTPKGKIIIALSLDVSTDHVPNAKLVVTDEGIGIETSFLNHIFKPFTQEDISSTRFYTGAGLGLSITKQVVTALKGKISIDSIKGEGTKICVELPIKAYFGSDQKSVKKSVMSLNEFSDDEIVHVSQLPPVLIVEDNPVNQLVVTKILESRGIQCEVANDGLEALNMIQRKLYHLVFMDCHMPKMDGYECTRLIRELPGGDRVFIVAMTANAMLGDRQKCLDAGMNEYLSKPIDYSKMMEFITLNNKKH